MGITGTIPATVDQVDKYVAGETIAARSAVCFSETEEKVYQAQATSWSRMPAIGVARAAAKAGGTVGVYESGTVSHVLRTENFPYFDNPVFVSKEAGKLTATPVEGVGDIYQEVGKNSNNSDVVLNLQTAIELG